LSGASVLTESSTPRTVGRLGTPSAAPFWLVRVTTWSPESGGSQVHVTAVAVSAVPTGTHGVTPPRRIELAELGSRKPEPTSPTVHCVGVVETIEAPLSLGVAASA
jgi:hypothetical protein